MNSRQFQNTSFKCLKLILMKARLDARSLNVLASLRRAVRGSSFSTIFENVILFKDSLQKGSADLESCPILATKQSHGSSILGTSVILVTLAHFRHFSSF
jgi:hypothetical protein